MRHNKTVLTTTAIATDAQCNVLWKERHLSQKKWKNGNQKRFYDKGSQFF